MRENIVPVVNPPMLFLVIIQPNTDPLNSNLGIVFITWPQRHIPVVPLAAKNIVDLI
jgi:hypothetical protein